jgi:hypothetical protein
MPNDIKRFKNSIPRPSKIDQKWEFGYENQDHLATLALITSS